MEPPSLPAEEARLFRQLEGSYARFSEADPFVDEPYVESLRKWHAIVAGTAKANSSASASRYRSRRKHCVALLRACGPGLELVCSESSWNTLDKLFRLRRREIIETWWASQPDSRRLHENAGRILDRAGLSPIDL